MIRAQYHFRPSPQGLLAWDVRRLVTLSHGLPVILDASGRVMDGMHRACRALLEGRAEILAVQFCNDPPPDCVGREPGSLPYD